MFETARLVAVGWTPDDLADAHAIWGDPEVMRFVGAPHADGERTRRALQTGMRVLEQRGFTLWRLVDRARGVTVGCCGFHDWQEPTLPGDSAAARPPGLVLELVFHLARAEWGRGYATEAGAAALCYAFDELGADCVVALTHPGNAGSERVLKKLGFRATGDDDGEHAYVRWPFPSTKASIA